MPVEIRQTLTLARERKRPILCHRESDGPNLAEERNELFHEFPIFRQLKRPICQKKTTLQVQLVGTLDLPEVSLQLEQLSVKLSTPLFAH
jgi:hypothetical protein